MYQVPSLATYHAGIGTVCTPSKLASASIHTPAQVTTQLCKWQRRGRISYLALFPSSPRPLLPRSSPIKPAQDRAESPVSQSAPVPPYAPVSLRPPHWVRRPRPHSRERSPPPLPPRSWQRKREKPSPSFASESLRAATGSAVTAGLHYIPPIHCCLRWPLTSSLPVSWWVSRLSCHSVAFAVRDLTVKARATLRINLYQPLSAICHLPSAICYQPSAIYHLSVSPGPRLSLKGFAPHPRPPKLA
ncbi:hypothetical protein B0H67DRAFT_51554 [Lasiosphaeris hirsuta]|uniref:Uncharacterized protein n=1 Tax=Lasiosphaeris hirsuta TaxID=260670 RepID=A0AA40EB55_9PEZI|nr:hypothetical protein B0H67DRAFT_51554 [Lasiosphaeris hirsuta]